MVACAGHRFLIPPFIADGDAASAEIAKIVPGGAVELGGIVPGTVPSDVGRNRSAQLADGTVEAALHYDVDHAGDRVRAIGSRGACGKYINAINRQTGDNRRIDVFKIGALAGMAATIDHQECGCRLSADAMNFCVLEPLPVSARNFHCVDADISGNRGNIRQHFRNRNGTDFLELFFTYRRDGNADCRSSADKRASYQDFFLGGRYSRCCCGRRRRGGKSLPGRSDRQQGYRTEKRRKAQ